MISMEKTSFHHRRPTLRTSMFDVKSVRTKHSTKLLDHIFWGTTTKNAFVISTTTSTFYILMFFFGESRFERIKKFMDFLCSKNLLRKEKRHSKHHHNTAGINPNRCKVQTNHLPSDPHRAGRRFSSSFRETRSVAWCFKQPLGVQVSRRCFSERSEGSPEFFFEAWESKQKIYIHVFIKGAKEWQVCRFRRSIQKPEDDISRRKRRMN